MVDKQAEVREATVLALGSLELDAERIRPHLAKALRDDSSEVRRAASRAIQRQGSQGAIFLPDIILLAESKENFKSVERLLRSFERTGPDVRSLPELVNHLGHDQAAVRLLAIKFLGLAGQNAKDAIPALERLREDPSAEVRKQAEAACERIKTRRHPAPVSHPSRTMPCLRALAKALPLVGGKPEGRRRPSGPKVVEFVAGARGAAASHDKFAELVRTQRRVRFSPLSHARFGGCAPQESSSFYFDFLESNRRLSTCVLA